MKGKKILISPRSGRLLPYLKELWSYKRLILTFARRDLKIQYAQTLLGVFWVALQPLTGLLIFTLFFDKLMQVDTGPIPYPLFAFSGMLAWFFFISVIVRAGESLTTSQELLSNLYFPKLVLPLSKLIVGLVEFGISLVILFALMIILGQAPGPELLLLPVFLLINIILALSLGIWIAALSVRFRDFQHIVPYIVNFGIWLTPVFYPTTIIPSEYTFFLYLNPMAGIIAGYRWAILGGVAPSTWYWLGFIPVILLFVLGVLYFRRIEGKVVDLI